jgi:hypothetical protein
MLRPTSDLRFVPMSDVEGLAKYERSRQLGAALLVVLA